MEWATRAECCCVYKPCFVRLLKEEDPLTYMYVPTLKCYIESLLHTHFIHVVFTSDQINYNTF